MPPLFSAPSLRLPLSQKIGEVPQGFVSAPHHCDKLPNEPISRHKPPPLAHNINLPNEPTAFPQTTS